MYGFFYVNENAINQAKLKFKIFLSFGSLQHINFNVNDLDQTELKLIFAEHLLRRRLFLLGAQIQSSDSDIDSYA